MTKDNEIYIGLFPPDGTDWAAMMAAILGTPHYDSDVPYIDSRLNAVYCRTEREEGNILGNRWHLWVKDEESLAVLLYRLEELYSFPPNLPDRVIERGEEWAREILNRYLGLDEDTDYLLSDGVPILACHQCGALPPELEGQDEVYICNECGWQVHYQSSWPHVCYFDRKRFPHWFTLGTVKAVVSRQLATRNKNGTV